jgi:hypothetical protein
MLREVYHLMHARLFATVIYGNTPIANASGERMTAAEFENRENKWQKPKT